MDYIEQKGSLTERFGILSSYSWKHWLGSFSKAGGSSMKQSVWKLWVPMCPAHIRHQGENKTVGRIAGKLISLHTREYFQTKGSVQVRISEVHEAPSCWR